MTTDQTSKPTCKHLWRKLSAYCGCLRCTRCGKVKTRGRIYDV